MTANKRADWSYLLVLPFLAISWIPILAQYWKMRYTYMLAVLWLAIAFAQRRPVRLPWKGIINLAGAFIFLSLYTNLNIVYSMFGIGSEWTYESVANSLQVFVPLAIFHLSVCNGRQNELRLLVFFCFICLAVGAVMTYLGEFEIEGGSRALTGSTDDAQFAFLAGIGSYGFIYGTGLLIIPILYGMTFMSAPLKIILSTFIVALFVAVYRASYSILMGAMALACALYVANKVGLRQRYVNLMGVFLVTILVIATAFPQILSFMTDPVNRLSSITTNSDYSVRLVSVSDAMSGAAGTYAEQRASLYWDSWRVFLKYPVFGGGSGDNRRPAQDWVGGHSTIFDTLGFYGLFGLTIYILFFICHYRYMRVVSAIVIGDKWWPSYYIFMFSATAVMFINPYSGGPLFFNLCLYIPSLTLFFKKEYRLVEAQQESDHRNPFRK